MDLPKMDHSRSRLQWDSNSDHLTTISQRCSWKSPIMKCPLTTERLRHIGKRALYHFSRKKEMKAVSAQGVSCCVYDKSPIKYVAHARQRSIHVWLLCRSSCSSPWLTERVLVITKTLLEQLLPRAVIVAQLVEQLLPIPVVCSVNPDIGEICVEHLLIVNWI